MILPIMIYGEPVLGQAAAPVARIDDGIRGLAADMLETMYAADGVGLAAEQIGRTERVCVIDVPRDAEYEGFVGQNDSISMPLVMVNPRVVSVEGASRRQEGCLSFPGLYVNISRGASVTFEYTNLDGETVTQTAHGLLARAVQHEIDHLDGRTMPDHFTAAQRITYANKLKKLKARAKL